MNRALINFVKYNTVVYNLYYHIGSCLLRLWSKFLSPNKKCIVFNSFGGRKYDDSTRAIYEEMLKDDRFKDFLFVWALTEPEKFDIPGAKKVKSDTLAYYKTLLTSSVWVTNSTMERGLSFKTNNIFNLNTWHGTAIKKMGSDISSENASFGSKGKDSHDNVMLAQGQYDVEIFSRVFRVPIENFRVIGLPRNDELVHNNSEEFRSEIRKRLGIVDSKKIILYAPTFREYDKDSGSNCTLSLPIDLMKWEKELSCDFVLLMRAHYEVVKGINFEENEFVKNVSSYPNLNELMIVSDLLISDYSSIFFDYAIQDKPMLCFAYDYEKYVSKRGLYFDIREKLYSNSKNEDELITTLRNLDVVKAIAYTQAFRKEFIQEYGQASKKAVDIIWNYLNGNDY